MSSIFIDWSSINYEEWENVTQRILREILEDSEHEDFKAVAERLEVLKEDGTLEDYYEESINNYEPMMNYGHILETSPSDEDVLRVALNTNCSVMYNSETNQYFIVLNGGGMDLSQDIALSYYYLQKWIPYDLINSVCSQKGFSISEENFETLREQIIEQSKHYADRLKELNKRWKELK